MTLVPPNVADLLSLTGRTAIVTGGAMGIGRAVAERLAEAGAAVVIADVDAEVATTAVKELTDRDLQAWAVQADVGDERDVIRMVEETTTWAGDLDILVNNAGIFPAVPVLDMTADDFDHVLRVNLRGTFLCARQAALTMRTQGHGGRIINITSVDALHPSAVGLAHYDASKHGVWGFTKNLARELAPHSIWVNAIAPGAIATPGVASMQSSNGAVDPQEMLDTFLARIPMARMGVPDDIGRVALFLASDLASYITGAQIVVDGGVLLT